MKILFLGMLLLLGSQYLTAQDANDLVKLNTEVTLLKSASLLMRGQYSLDLNLSIQFKREVKILGFYYNKRKLNGASGQSHEVSPEGETLNRQFELRNISTQYSISDSENPEKPLKERLVLKYKRSGKVYYVKIPLEMLRSKTVKPAGTEGGVPKKRQR